MARVTESIACLLVLRLPARLGLTFALVSIQCDLSLLEEKHHLNGQILVVCLLGFELCQNIYSPNWFYKTYMEAS